MQTSGAQRAPRPYYSRAPWPANRRPALFEPDDDSSQPAIRTRIPAAA